MNKKNSFNFLSILFLLVVFLSYTRTTTGAISYFPQLITPSEIRFIPVESPGTEFLTPVNNHAPQQILPHYTISGDWEPISRLRELTPGPFSTLMHAGNAASGNRCILLRICKLQV